MNNNELIMKRRKFMDGIKKGLLVFLLVLYVISPVDLCPGPIDDLLLVLFTFASKRNTG